MRAKSNATTLTAADSSPAESEVSPQPTTPPPERTDRMEKRDATVKPDEKEEDEYLAGGYEASEFEVAQCDDITGAERRAGHNSTAAEAAVEHDCIGDFAHVVENEDSPPALVDTFDMAKYMAGEEQEEAAVSFSDKDSPTTAIEEQEQEWTQHIKVFPGEDWGVLLENSQLLTVAFKADVCEACDLVTKDVRHVEFALGSLHVCFELGHSPEVTRQQMDNQLEVAPYPRMMALYGLLTKRTTPPDTPIPVPCTSLQAREAQQGEEHNDAVSSGKQCNWTEASSTVADATENWNELSTIDENSDEEEDIKRHPTVVERRSKVLEEPSYLPDAVTDEFNHHEQLVGGYEMEGEFAVAECDCGCGDVGHVSHTPKQSSPSAAVAVEVVPAMDGSVLAATEEEEAQPLGTFDMERYMAGEEQDPGPGAMMTINSPGTPKKDECNATASTCNRPIDPPRQSRQEMIGASSKVESLRLEVSNAHRRKVSIIVYETPLMREEACVSPTFTSFSESGSCSSARLERLTSVALGNNDTCSAAEAAPAVCQTLREEETEEQEKRRNSVDMKKRSWSTGPAEVAEGGADASYYQESPPQSARASLPVHGTLDGTISTYDANPMLPQFRSIVTKGFAGLRPLQNPYRDQAFKGASAALDMCYPLNALRDGIRTPEDLYKHYCRCFHIQVNHEVVKSFRDATIAGSGPAVLAEAEASSSCDKRQRDSVTWKELLDPANLSTIYDIRIPHLLFKDAGFLPVLEVLRWSPNVSSLDISGNGLSNEAVEWLAHAALECDNAPLLQTTIYNLLHKGLPDSASESEEEKKRSPRTDAEVAETNGVSTAFVVLLRELEPLGDTLSSMYDTSFGQVRFIGANCNRFSLGAVRLTKRLLKARPNLSRVGMVGTGENINLINGKIPKVNKHRMIL